MASFPPAPRDKDINSVRWRDWLDKLRKTISSAGLLFSDLNFTGSNITSIVSRDHNDLTSKQGGTTGEFYHITQTANDNVMAYLSGGSTGKGWADLLGEPTIRGVGASDPSWSVYRGNVRQYAFSNAVTNEMWFNYHIPHDYALGSDIFIHVHWSQNTVDTGGPSSAPGNVKWYFDVTYAKSHNQAAYPAPITTSVTATASSTQYQHLLSEVQLSASSPSASQINSSLLEPDGVILLRIYRDPSDAADTLDKTPFLHYCDIHYQSDRVNTKNKAPNFYA